MNKTEIINNYLYYGYLPPKQFPAWLNDGLNLSENFDYSVKGAAQVFDKIFDELLAKYPNKKHIVPLSGGRDSRAILGALLERVDKSQIETVTFGVPGQLDYDIGIKVAKWAGVKYHAINLKKIEFTWENILISVKESPWTYVPDGMFNSISRNTFSVKDDIIWSGFLGDPLTGSHLNKTTEKDVCINKFITEQQRVRKFNLFASCLQTNDIISKTKPNNMEWDDFLDFGIRQSNCIAPIVLPISNLTSFEQSISFERNGAIVVAPFLNERFKDYWLLAPRELRRNQKLYINMLNYKYPELFALPSKYSLGMPAKSGIRYNYKRYKNGVIRRIQKKAPWLGIRSTAHLNYLDYDTMFRKRNDYKETLNVALDFLKQTDITPWLNLDQLWTDHMKKKKDYGNVFCVLIGLAANLTNSSVNNKNNK